MKGEKEYPSSAANVLKRSLCAILCPYNEYMCIVSDRNDFMESMSEYMKIWKRDK